MNNQPSFIEILNEAYRDFLLARLPRWAAAYVLGVSYILIVLFCLALILSPMWVGELIAGELGKDIGIIIFAVTVTLSMLSAMIYVELPERKPKQEMKHDRPIFTCNPEDVPVSFKSGHLGDDGEYELYKDADNK